LHGRPVGVVGLGDVGLAFAERAAAFGTVVRGVARAGRAADVRRRIAAIGMELVADLPTLAERSEVLSFHVPLTDATRDLVDADLLAHVQPGAVILNTSRGEIVDEAALIEAMDAKDVRAGVDVYRGEPATAEATFASALARHPNVYGTHHIGASTRQAQEAIADEVLMILDAFTEGETRNCVNLDLLREAGAAVRTTGGDGGPA
ncbi:MAG: NAD(P)-dependent oxidoreductase, partial [Nitriliruptorales bacterium]